MLILSALGVDKEPTLEYYMLTNEYNADKIAEEYQRMAERGILE